MKPIALDSKPEEPLTNDSRVRVGRLAPATPSPVACSAFTYCVLSEQFNESVDAIACTTASCTSIDHRNQQYSIYALTDSSGNVSERYAYTAYGQPTFLSASATVQTSSAANNRYTYTAREWDQTIGLHHFRARWMSGMTGRFITRDPIGYVDGMSMYFSVLPMHGVDPAGNAASPAECASKKAKCKQLRDIWANDGKAMTVAWFDRWLNKTGCPSPRTVDIDSVSPGATAALLSNQYFRAGIRNAFGCSPGCVFGEPFDAQLLPTSSVINGWFNDPLHDLDDIQYLVGSIRGVLTGCLNNKSCSTFTSTAGGGSNTTTCCDYSGTLLFSVWDKFHFPGGWRNFNIPNPIWTNPFAEYNEACEFLENNCGYCSQPWNASGSINITKTCCSTCLSVR